MKAFGTIEQTALADEDLRRLDQTSKPSGKAERKTV